ncbi:FR47-like protein [Quadrisphaera granulorum]|uniref:FR47-like protein n=1 Tax=Quadrisphaera granulorum TaxID=317664 RepID=A0A316A5F9_9ACTN|nr:GNAT family N-acetyltransferase [Quadrisphaera granulorum]PWJ53121.1 FR47-like protein [Quadrisphaera granulorum]SZE97053.1 FR47-like protein [Quadrisphaera granulorum]
MTQLAPDPRGTDLPVLDQLDRAVWNALHGPHAALAVRQGRVVTYPADVSVFASLPASPTPADWDDAAALARAGADGLLVVTGDVPEPPADWTVLMDLPGVQMVATDAVASAPFPEAVQLDLHDRRDVADALALVERTKPGPFFPRTMAMGTYRGVRRGGELVAMAGERLHPEGAVEISAVCTDAAWRGQGLGTRLVQAVTHGIRERGEVPFLHASATNTGAIRLYEHLGFRLRRTTRFTALCPPTPTPRP